MPDALLSWGGDLSLTPSGDIAIADGTDLTAQQIIRRLLTSVNGEIFHLGYGAGLVQRVGNVATARVLQGIVRAQILLEATVATLPIPDIQVTQGLPGLFVIAINYTNAVTGVATAISFEVPGTR
jgi:hypothetical protein